MAGICELELTVTNATLTIQFLELISPSDLHRLSILLPGAIDAPYPTVILRRACFLCIPGRSAEIGIYQRFMRHPQYMPVGARSVKSAATHVTHT